MLDIVSHTPSKPGYKVDDKEWAWITGIRIRSMVSLVIGKSPDRLVTLQKETLDLEKLAVKTTVTFSD